jgi:putative hydrolase of the HAD superfamily
MIRTFWKTAMSRLPPVCIFFDLDDTLYPPGRGVWSEIARRINRYMVERVGIPETQVEGLRRHYFDAYGTTCNGLRAEKGVDPQDFYRFVHDIPLDRFLAPDPALRRMLTALGQKRFIFSNADRGHIARVLSALGVEDCFDGIVDIFATGLVPKPSEAAYRTATQLAGSPPADRCILVDDLPRNLWPARKLGWRTVLVHNRPADGSMDHHLETIYRLPELLT